MMSFVAHVQHALLKEHRSFLWRVTLALSLCEGCVSVVSECVVCVSYSHTRAHISTELSCSRYVNRLQC